MKNILLTGPSRGVGLAISKRLLDEGFSIIGVSRNLSSEYKDLIKNSKKGKAHFLEFDLNKVDEIPRLVNKLTKKYGPIYGLINNSAIGKDGLLATMHSSEISGVLKLNLESAITLTKYVCRSMLVQGKGRIISISSIIASTGFRGLSVYAASKAGLEGFTKSLSRELGSSKITVNCVAPGYMKTDMTKKIQTQNLKSIKKRSPLGLPRVDDVAGAVSYLLSKDSEKITGIVLTIDGGSTA